MEYETILVKESPGRLTVTINRLESRNSINDALLKELGSVLDMAEQDSKCRLLVLEGQDGFFCTGMDFNEYAEADSSENAEQIKDMVRGMQIQISIVANDLDVGRKIAAEEVEGAKKTTDNLDAIEADLDEVQEGIQVINVRAEEIKKALDQANRAVIEIANAAEEASKVADEASKAAEEGNKGMPGHLRSH